MPNCAMSSVDDDFVQSSSTIELRTRYAQALEPQSSTDVDAPRGGASSDFRAIVDDDDAYYGGRTQDPLTIPFPQDRTTTRYAPRLPDTTPVARPVGGRDLPSFSARTP